MIKEENLSLHYFYIGRKTICFINQNYVFFFLFFVCVCVYSDYRIPNKKRWLYFFTFEK